MTETNSAAANRPNFAITGQYVKDLSFEAPGTPQVFSQLNTSPSVEINVDVEAKPFENNMFEVALKFHIKSTFGGQQGFILELVYCALVALNLPQEQVQPALLVEAPRLIFPFARAIVSDVTRDSGFPALMVQPIDFVQLYNQRIQEMAAKQNMPAPTPVEEKAGKKPSKGKAS
ncbi:MAG: protein-export chaperone SecB [Alphaproteobacteria bacterium RIFOXYD12_FULL_60_8]|nr:MAG: protein-export chaperone SecB [Alphaproteobacteria bacterium RIFOXYD12_FULL_60_8]